MSDPVSLFPDMTTGDLDSTSVINLVDCYLFAWSKRKSYIQKAKLEQKLIYLSSMKKRFVILRISEHLQHYSMPFSKHLMYNNQ